VVAFVKKSFFFFALTILLVLPAFQGQGGEPGGILDTGPVPVSRNLTTWKVVFVEFLPPAEGMEGQGRDERVFTGEISRKGSFHPRNALDLVHGNIRAAGALHGLSFEIVESVAMIPHDADIAVFGAVVRCMAGKEAVVELECEFLEVKAGVSLGRRTFARTVQGEGIPLLVGRPVHMVGSHMNDFHPQRTIINAAAYLCVTDLVRYLDELAGKRR